MKSKLTAESLRFNLTYDPITGVFYRRITSAMSRVGDLVGSKQGNGYLVISVNGVQYYAHRLAWLYMTGAWSAQQLDHINRDRSNNSWSNLREATNGQNNQNKLTRTDNKSGMTGVSFFKPHKLWRARISVHGTEIHLGYFATKEEAMAARVVATAKYHGEYAPQE